MFLTILTGGYGYDFSSQTDKILDAVKIVSKGLLATGVTSYCPTLVTSPPEVYKEVGTIQLISYHRVTS